jgi:hypothetical protein
MNEERKLTLRNHAELFAGDLDEVALNLGNIIDDIDANEDEWIDDEVYQGMQDLFDAVRDAVDKAWELENLCQEREMGKKRF